MFRFAHFFIDRPIFATVPLGAADDRRCHYPARPADLRISRDRAPDGLDPPRPTPAPRPRSSRSTVATPIEQEVNGVDDMLYMHVAVDAATATAASRSMSCSRSALDLDQAQVLVQNRVSLAEPRLPQDRAPRSASASRKNSPDFLMVMQHDLARQERATSNTSRTMLRST